jgi:hypothetical protein
MPDKYEVPYTRMLVCIIDRAYTVKELETATGVHYKTVSRFLASLGRLVYVDEWRSDLGGVRKTAKAYRFTLRPKPDAPKPAPMNRKEIDARKYQRLKSLRVNSVFALASSSRRVQAERRARGADGKFLPKDSI